MTYLFTRHVPSPSTGDLSWIALSVSLLTCFQSRFLEMFMRVSKSIQGIFYPGDPLANYDNTGVGKGKFKNVNIAFMADEKNPLQDLDYKFAFDTVSLIFQILCKIINNH